MFTGDTIWLLMAISRAPLRQVRQLRAKTMEARPQGSATRSGSGGLMFFFQNRVSRELREIFFVASALGCLL